MRLSKGRLIVFHLQQSLRPQGMQERRTFSRWATAAAAVLAGAALALGVAVDALAASSEVNTGPVHGRIIGQNYYPVVGTHWKFNVTVTDRHGHALSGTLNVEFTLDGSVVGHDKPPVDSFHNGHWGEYLIFPNLQEVGLHGFAVQVVVHTKDGSITLVWPILVKR
ncbi:MAG: hypothetical protein ACLP01_04965 [Solirubrobacteraceae bacterium]